MTTVGTPHVIQKKYPPKKDFTRKQSVKSIKKNSIIAKKIKWCAPEVLSGDHYSFYADVFSFGVVTWECLTAKKPYLDLKPLQVAQQVLEGRRLEIPEWSPQVLKKFMEVQWAAKENLKNWVSGGGAIWI